MQVLVALLRWLPETVSSTFHFINGNCTTSRAKKKGKRGLDSCAALLRYFFVCTIFHAQAKLTDSLEESCKQWVSCPVNHTWSQSHPSRTTKMQVLVAFSKVAPWNSFQHISRHRFWCAITTTLYHHGTHVAIMVSKKTAQSLVNMLMSFSHHNTLP